MSQIEHEYAEALFSIALESGCISEYSEHLSFIRQILEKNPEYIEYISSPVPSMRERLRALDEVFEESLPEYLVSFLKVLCEANRFELILGCIHEFNLLVMRLENRISAVIYSAVPLSEGQKQAVCEKLQTLTQKKIDPTYRLDESLIGGLKIEVDGKTYDGSIKHRLGEMKDVMNA